jgi:hypothetical protein
LPIVSGPASEGAGVLVDAGHIDLLEPRHEPQPAPEEFDGSVAVGLCDGDDLRRFGLALLGMVWTSDGVAVGGECERQHRWSVGGASEGDRRLGHVEAPDVGRAERERDGEAGQHDGPRGEVARGRQCRRCFL